MKRARKILAWGGLALILLCTSATVVPRLLRGSQADSQVASIKGELGYQNPAWLDRAWRLPVAALYRMDLVYQRNPSVCGPTSIVNVLHSLKQPGNQDTILQGTGLSTVFGYLPEGVTLDQLAVIARQKIGKQVRVLRDLDLAAFREHLRHVNDPGRRYVINFARGPLFGAGGGHHSPLAGYLIDADLVLVLDVNKAYGPWLVKSARLYEAMNTLDRDAGKKRGLLLIE